MYSATNNPNPLGARTLKLLGGDESAFLNQQHNCGMESHYQPRLYSLPPDRSARAALGSATMQSRPGQQRRAVVYNVNRVARQQKPSIPARQGLQPAFALSLYLFLSTPLANYIPGFERICSNMFCKSGYVG